jgi:hypothetical protein
MGGRFGKYGDIKRKARLRQSGYRGRKNELSRRLEYLDLRGARTSDRVSNLYPPLEDGSTGGGLNAPRKGELTLVRRRRIKKKTKGLRRQPKARRKVRSIRN